MRISISLQWWKHFAVEWNDIYLYVDILSGGCLRQLRAIEMWCNAWKLMFDWR